MIIFIKMNFFLLEVTYMQKKKSNISEGGYKQFMRSSFLTKFYIFDFENSLDWIKRKWTDQ